jgi:hypothetical protein
MSTLVSHDRLRPTLFAPQKVSSQGVRWASQGVPCKVRPQHGQTIFNSAKLDPGDREVHCGLEAIRLPCEHHSVLFNRPSGVTKIGIAVAKIDPRVEILRVYKQHAFKFRDAARRLPRLQGDEPPQPEGLKKVGGAGQDLIAPLAGEISLAGFTSNLSRL